MNRARYLIPGALYLLLLAPPSLAQNPASGRQYVYEYARPGRPTIDVFIWGNVAAPGMWRVEPDVDLIELLSVARIPGVGVDQPGIREQMILRIYREDGTRRNEIYNRRLDQMISEGGAYPALQDGDILEVVLVRRRRFGLETVAQFAGTAASLAVLIIQLARL